MAGFPEEDKVEEHEWYTPDWVFEGIGYLFDLDPCATRKKLGPAYKHYFIEDDGLSQEWEGIVWLNPPYGRDIRKWMSKMKKHGNGIALTNARTETKWFQENMGDAVLFPKGRIRFISGDTMEEEGNPRVPSVFIAYGPKAVEILSKAKIAGIFLRS